MTTFKPWLRFFPYVATATAIVCPLFFLTPDGPAPTARCDERLNAVFSITVASLASGPGRDLPDGRWHVEADPARFVQSLEKPLDVRCAWNDPSAALIEAESRYRADCKAAEAHVGGPEATSEHDAVMACFRSFLVYKHVLAKTFPRGNPSEALSRLEALAVPALLSLSGPMDEGAGDAAGQLAEQARVAGFPGLAVAAGRLALRTRYLDWVGSTRFEGKRPPLDAAEKFLEQVSPDDPLLLEARLQRVRRTRGAKELRREALRQRKEHGKSSVPDYHLAWAAQLRKDTKSALWHLGQVLALTPDDSRANYTLARLSGEAGAEADLVFLDALKRGPPLSLALIRPGEMDVQ